VCAFFDFQMPPEAAAGAGALWVNETKLFTLKVIQ